MIRAVIVDDEPAAAIIIRYFIHMGNLPIEIVGEARDGAAAIEMLNACDPQLVFLDIHMPGMSGFDLMQALPNYNYILVTAYESFQYAQQALRLGAKDILLKPVELEPLVNAVVRALGWKFTKNNLTNNVIEYIQSNYAEKIGVNDLAKRYFTTPSYLSRCFKKHMDTSVIAYLHEVRIRNAVVMMQSSDVGIKEISEACGYENINNFYKYFKQIHGCTPAVYREQLSYKKELRTESGSTEL